MTNRVTRLFKEPLVQFVIIGAAIYGLFAIYGQSDETENNRSIQVTANHIEAFINQWESRWNRPPTQQASQKNSRH